MLCCPKKKGTSDALALHLFARQAYFIDLFVRPSNALAVGLYQNLDYAVHRVVREYYQGGGPGGSDEDGYGESMLMRTRVLLAATSKNTEEEEADSCFYLCLYCGSQICVKHSREIPNERPYERAVKA